MIEDDVKRLSSGIRLGIQQSAADLTIDARSSAREMGWTRQDAAAIKVTPDTDRLVLSIGETAQAVEYGGPGVPPSPAIRRWANDSIEIEKRVVKRVESSLRGVL